VLLPPPAHRVPLMVGSNGDRMLAITLPYVDAWNTWYDDYGNSAEGFASLNARITSAAEAVGRDPRQIARSACAFVALDGASNDRPYDKEAPAVEGSMADIAAHVGALAKAGADEVIIVVSPVTVDSIRALGAMVELVDRSR